MVCVCGVDFELPHIRSLLLGQGSFFAVELGGGGGTLVSYIYALMS